MGRERRIAICRDSFSGAHKSSESRNATYSPRASRSAALRTMAGMPVCVSHSSLTRLSASSVRRYARVSASEPSSATMSSQSCKVWRQTEATVGRRYCSRPNVGRMIDTTGCIEARTRPSPQRQHSALDSECLRSIERFLSHYGRIAKVATTHRPSPLYLLNDGALYAKGFAGDFRTFLGVPTRDRAYT